MKNQNIYLKEKQLTALELKLKREVEAGRQNFPLQGKINKLKKEITQFNNQANQGWQNHLAR